MEALGYFITPHAGTKYFVQKPSHVRGEAHLPALLKAIELVDYSDGGLTVYHGGDVDVEPVYLNACCPAYVIVEDMLDGLGTFHTRWSPLSSVPLEHDHLRRERFAVVDFASTEEEARLIVERWKSK